mmetsp:Transcript_68545/g.178091  ORF Transcript_68545/g.178091 Transcript_68545/m.178091 type:complete len:603 (+) Transcript_68545:214-2022(+)
MQPICSSLDRVQLAGRQELKPALASPTLALPATHDAQGGGRESAAGHRAREEQGRRNLDRRRLARHQAVVLLEQLLLHLLYRGRARRREGRASALVGEDSVPRVGADADAELTGGAHPQRLARSVVPIRQVPLRQREGHLSRHARLQERLCEALEDPFRLAVRIARDVRGEGQVQLRDLVAGARTVVFHGEGDLHQGVARAPDHLRVGVFHLRGAVGEETEAKGIGHLNLLGVIPPIPDQALLRVDSVLLVLDAVAELDARTLVGDRAVLRPALREGEGQAAAGLVLLAIERHGDAAAVLLTWQPRDEDSRDALVPRRGDHGPRRVDDDDDLLACGGELLDHRDVLGVQLEGAAVPALAGLLGRDHGDDDLGAHAVRRALQLRTALQARDAVLEVHFRHLVAGEAVPAAAPGLCQGISGASLRSDERYDGVLGQWQDTAGVLQQNGGFGDDSRCQVELAWRLVIVTAHVRASLQLLAEQSHLHGTRMRGAAAVLGLTKGVVLVDAGLPIIRLLSRSLGCRGGRAVQTPRATLLGEALVARGRKLRVRARAADVVAALRPPTAPAVTLALVLRRNWSTGSRWLRWQCILNNSRRNARASAAAA